MVPGLALAALLALTCEVRPLHAGPLFGGDDTGCVPSSETSLQCENAVQAARCKLLTCLAACHVKMAKADQKTMSASFDDGACESDCLSRAQKGLTKISGNDTCPPCLVNNAANVLVTDVAQQDSTLGLTYCAGSTPMDVGYTGAIPPDTESLRCENKILTLRADLAASVCKCHARLAKDAFGSQTAVDDDACEAAAVTKAQAAASRLLQSGDCPACLDQSGGGILTGVDRDYLAHTNGQVYCDCGGGSCLAPSFANAVQPIYTASCASCHRGGFSPAPALVAGSAYAATVNAASMANPSLDYVTPGEPASSFLYQKITNTQGANFGYMMPTRAPLSPSQIATIQQWIECGAPNN